MLHRVSMVRGVTLVMLAAKCRESAKKSSIWRLFEWTSTPVSSSANCVFLLKEGHLALTGCACSLIPDEGEIQDLWVRARTDQDGYYRIELPVGNYNIEAGLGRRTTTTRAVEMRNSEQTEVDLDILWGPLVGGDPANDRLIGPSFLVNSRRTDQLGPRAARESIGEMGVCPQLS